MKTVALLPAAPKKDSLCDFNMFCQFFQTEFRLNNDQRYTTPTFQFTIHKWIVSYSRNKMLNSLPNIQKYASFKNPFWKRRCVAQSSTLLLEYILMCGSVNRVWPIFWFFMPQPNGCNWPLIKFSLTYSTK